MKQSLAFKKTTMTHEHQSYLELDKEWPDNLMPVVSSLQWLGAIKNYLRKTSGL